MRRDVTKLVLVSIVALEAAFLLWAVVHRRRAAALETFYDAPGQRKTHRRPWVVAPVAAVALVVAAAEDSVSEFTRVEDAVMYDETLVHLPCLLLLLAQRRKQPLSALVVFGGDGAALKEMLKYRQDVSSVTVLDYDRGAAGNDSGSDDVHWIVGDVGDSLYKLTSGGNELLKRYDIIIVDLAKNTRRPNEPLSRDDAARIALLLDKDGGVVAVGSKRTSESPTMPMPMTMPSTVVYADHGFNITIGSKSVIKIPTAEEAAARLKRDNVGVSRFDPAECFDTAKLK